MEIFPRFTNVVQSDEETNCDNVGEDNSSLSGHFPRCSYLHFEHIIKVSIDVAFYCQGGGQGGQKI